MLLGARRWAEVCRGAMAMTAVVESLRLVTNWPWRFDRPRTWVRLPRSVDNAGRGKADSRAGVATKRENSLGFVLG